MSDSLWHAVDAELDRAAEAGRSIEIWLRDDDAVDVTPALERLTGLCEAHAMPVLLAVIPEPAQTTLAGFVSKHPSLVPTQHGFNHTNHASPGKRACELGGLRGQADVMADLARGRGILRELFGRAMADIIVPPWNRIDESLLAGLPDLGFTAISAFGLPGPRIPGLASINCDLDIIDWRNGRHCHPHDKLARKLAGLLVSAWDTGKPIGLLTHHLAHDELAWDFLEVCLNRLKRHPAVHFVNVGSLV